MLVSQIRPMGGWLRNLFGSDEGKRGALVLKADVYEDEVRGDANEIRVRVIGAATGSTAFDVVTINASGERHVFSGNMVYGEDSGAKKLDEDFTGLHVTAANSSDAAMELENVTSLPMDATIFLIGTTFEGVPYKMLVLPNGPGTAEGTASSSKSTARLIGRRLRPRIFTGDWTPASTTATSTDNRGTAGSHRALVNSHARILPSLPVGRREGVISMPHRRGWEFEQEMVKLYEGWTTLLPACGKAERWHSLPSQTYYIPDIKLGV